MFLSFLPHFQNQTILIPSKIDLVNDSVNLLTIYWTLRVDTLHNLFAAFVTDMHPKTKDQLLNEIERYESL